MKLYSIFLVTVTLGSAIAAAGPRQARALLGDVEIYSRVIYEEPLGMEQSTHPPNLKSCMKSAQCNTASKNKVRFASQAKLKFYDLGSKSDARPDTYSININPPAPPPQPQRLVWPATNFDRDQRARGRG